LIPNKSNPNLLNPNSLNPNSLNERTQQTMNSLNYKLIESKIAEQL